MSKVKLIKLDKHFLKKMIIHHHFDPDKWKIAFNNYDPSVRTLKFILTRPDGAKLKINMIFEATEFSFEEVIRDG